VDEQALEAFLDELIWLDREMRISRVRFIEALPLLDPRRIDPKQPPTGDLDHSLDLMASVWLEVRSMLSTGANVSKMFSAERPQPRKGRKDAESEERYRVAVERCSQLAEALRYEDLEQIPPSIRRRGVRNGLEHLEQRLDGYWASDNPGSYNDRTIDFGGGAVAGVIHWIGGVERRNIRVIHVPTLTVLVPNRNEGKPPDDISLCDLWGAVSEVAQRAQDWKDADSPTARQFLARRPDLAHLTREERIARHRRMISERDALGRQQ
jgi:hypothetical protein